MSKKLKLALLTLLGFSTACSSVKNTPAKGGDKQTSEADSVVVKGSGSDLRHVIVMYGVRPPRGAGEVLESPLQQQPDSLRTESADALPEQADTTSGSGTSAESSDR